MNIHPSPIKLAILLLLATRPISHAESTPVQAVQQLPGYAELIALPPEAIKGYDIAVLNLLCAKGLPGAESLDLSRKLAVLDRWAAIVKEAERRFLPSFHRNPARYDGSLSVFKAVNLALTLKQDVGYGYNMELVKSGAMADIHSTRFFRDPKDLFLHGFTGRKQGSCASLPVLMVAVGRRCGYACHSSSTQPVLGSGASGMSIRGAATGTMIPLPFGYYIDTGGGE